MRIEEQKQKKKKNRFSMGTEANKPRAKENEYK